MIKVGILRDVGGLWFGDKMKIARSEPEFEVQPCGPANLPFQIHYVNIPRKSPGGSVHLQSPKTGSGREASSLCWQS